MRMIAFLAAVLLAGSSLEPDWVTDLRYCDLVVAGTVSTATVSLAPRLDVQPIFPGGHEGTYVEVATISLVIDEVMRGRAPSDSLSFISLVGSSLMRRNYSPGQQLLIGLKWSNHLFGGSYWLYTEGARFVHSEAGWVGQGSATTLKNLTEVRRRLDEVAPTVVLNHSDFVVVGVVDSMKAKTIYGNDGTNAVQWSITLANVQSLRGPAVPSEIAIRQITSGGYWPDWRDAAPLRSMIEPGTPYCFFLRKIPDGYAPVSGINGMFEVRGDSLYFAGRTPIDLTIEDIKHSSK